MKSLSERELAVLAQLQKDGYDYYKPFDINEEDLSRFMAAYASVFHKGSSTLNSGNFRYARKLAGAVTN